MDFISVKQYVFKGYLLPYCSNGVTKAYFILTEYKLQVHVTQVLSLSTDALQFTIAKVDFI